MTFSVYDTKLPATAYGEKAEYLTNLPVDDIILKKQITYRYIYIYQKLLCFIFYCQNLQSNKYNAISFNFKQAAFLNITSLVR